MVYILKFHSPLGNQRHQANYYVGYCDDGTLERRLMEHRRGRGAAITQAARLRGIGFDVVLTMPGDRTTERRIKNQHNHGRFVERQLRLQSGRI